VVYTKTESAYQARNRSTQFESGRIVLDFETSSFLSDTLDRSRKPSLLIPSLARAKSARASTRGSMNSWGLGSPHRFGIYN
jgi:hypothetical protein